jgi:intracellular sulfur oxidation DsrE/DsrF family protein
MDNSMNKSKNPRREFLGSIATGAAALGIGSFLSPLDLQAAIPSVPNNYADADAWFNTIKGKHRIVFDATRPHEIMPFAWPRVYLLTNGATGTPEKDCSVVVVLRHDAIPYAMPDALWAKYKFGEMFKADDPGTKAPSVRNPFYKVPKGTYKAPGLGEISIGIDELQASGVMFCVCDAAMTLYSAVAAQMNNADAATVKKEWVDNLLPGIQVVPSGVWAVGRAQEHGCAYCFAG